MQDGILAGALLTRLRKDNCRAADAIAAAPDRGKASAGDARAFEIIRNTIGEKPRGQNKRSANQNGNQMDWTITVIPYAPRYPEVHDTLGIPALYRACGPSAFWQDSACGQSSYPRGLHVRRHCRSISPT